MGWAVGKDLTYTKNGDVKWSRPFGEKGQDHLVKRSRPFGEKVKTI
jgi:hypothetical protein